jgi:transposase
MDKVRVFVGIDVSKGWLDLACLVPGEGVVHSLRCANTASGIGLAVREVRKSCNAGLGELLFCLEHTGAYCAPFLAYAAKAGLAAWLESAWKIRRTQAPRGKSDRMDAARIAEYACRYRDRARLWEPEPEDIRRLRDLLAIRERLMSAATMLKLPKGEAAASGRKSAVKDMGRFSDPAVKALRRQKAEVEREIDGLVAQNPELKRNMGLACSIPGVGRMTALGLMLFTRNFTLFDDPRKLACYCGVAPFEYTSGTSVKRRSRVSDYANKALKKVLHMAAISAIQVNPDMRAYFGRKASEGKNKLAVINAVRNKLLHCITAVIRRQTPWVPKDGSGANAAQDKP